MAKKDIASIVSGSGLVASIMINLATAVRDKGGTDENVHHLATEESKSLWEQIAELIVGGDQISKWQKFYQEIFGLKVDFSGVKLPAKRDGFNWLVLMAQGLTYTQVIEACKKNFPTWTYYDDRGGLENNIDLAKEERTTAKSYAIRIRDRVEADEENQNLSANQIAEKKMATMTLLERIVLELFYWWSTGGKNGGQHLDINSWTLCSGSRGLDGDVPHASCLDGEFRVDWSNPDDASGFLRARLAV